MPYQCPECARFLKTSFVEGLAEAPAGCPKCGATLTVAQFPDVSVRPPDAAAVRPPDLPTAEVGGPVPDRDVLAGWDDGSVAMPSAASGAEGEVVDLARWRDEHQGLAPRAVAVLVAGAGALGVAVGATISPRSRTRGAFLGALIAGVAGVAAASWSRR